MCPLMGRLGLLNCCKPLWFHETEQDINQCSPFAIPPPPISVGGSFGPQAVCQTSLLLRLQQVAQIANMVFGPTCLHFTTVLVTSLVVCAPSECGKIFSKAFPFPQALWPLWWVQKVWIYLAFSEYLWNAFEVTDISCPEPRAHVGRT